MFSVNVGCLPNVKIIGTRTNAYDGFGQRLNKTTRSSGDENENEGDFCKCAFAR